MGNGRVVVAMSGGVDSSVAAMLLADQGYEVIGVTMRLWTTDRTDQSLLHKGCCSIEDTEDARQVCQSIGARHYVINAEREFQKYVIDYFLREYQTGRTPHPCIACNDRIKFDFLLERAMVMEADFIATGHYARVVPNEDGEIHLLKGVDSTKDQSYVLFGLSQKQLKKLSLPIGWFTKEEIRSKASERGLSIADKQDSQDICFIPQGSYREFFKTRLVPKAGEVVDTEGKILAKHQGIEYFTIGQRRGLGVTTGAPLYVVALDPNHGRVTVGSEKSLYSSVLRASRVNWTSGKPPLGPINVSVKIRYKSQQVSATIIPGQSEVEVRFNEPQRAITPGQAVVFYNDQQVIGGGFIVAPAGLGVGIQQTEPIPSVK